MTCTRSPVAMLAFVAMCSYNAAAEIPTRYPKNYCLQGVVDEARSEKVFKTMARGLENRRFKCDKQWAKDLWLETKQQIRYPEGSVKFQHTVNTEGTTYDSRYGQLSNASMPQIWNRLLERNTEDCTQYFRLGGAPSPDLHFADTTAAVKMCENKATKFQRLHIVDSGENHGKMLFLDCIAQSAEAEEFIYHETLVHPVMLAHDNPVRVLICGGGEGPTAREVLRYRSVEEVVMVELDAELMQFSRKHLPYSQGEYWSDNRLKVIAGDAVDYLINLVNDPKAARFDVIICDFPDAIPEYASVLFLFTVEFYRLAALALQPNGALSAQVGSLSYADYEFASTTSNSIQAAFSSEPNIAAFGSAVWGDAVGVVMAMSPNATDADVKPRVSDLSGAAVESRIADRIDNPSQLRFIYDGPSFSRIFDLPPHYVAIVKASDRMYSKQDVLRVHQAEKAGQIADAECYCTQTICSHAISNAKLTKRVDRHLVATDKHYTIAAGRRTSKKQRKPNNAKLVAFQKCNNNTCRSESARCAALPLCARAATCAVSGRIQEHMLLPSNASYCDGCDFGDHCLDDVLCATFHGLGADSKLQHSAASAVACKHLVQGAELGEHLLALIELVDCHRKSCNLKEESWEVEPRRGKTEL